MATEIKALICPQCGSADVEKASESEAVCRICGSKLMIQPQIDTQNIFNEYHFHSGEEEEPLNTNLRVARIQSEFEKDSFIRQAWIALMKEDAPFEVFEANFAPVKVISHEVFVEMLEADVDYHVSIGYDRQEPYIDYVTYKEKVGDQYVERVKPVTKYKTVTDWNLMQGKHHVSTIAMAENRPDAYLDEELFATSFRTMGDDSLSLASEEEETAITVREFTESSVNSKHNLQIKQSILSILPGDKHKDLDYQINKITDIGRSIYFVEEFETSIEVNGQTYEKHAFPFGYMKIGGDQIKNEDSLRKNRQVLKDKIPGMAWQRSKPTAFLALGILGVSILVSLFLHYTVLVILAFAAGVAGYIYNFIKSSKHEKEVTEEVEREIEEFSIHYKTKQLDLLNRKLDSLGYAAYKPEESK